MRATPTTYAMLCEGLERLPLPVFIKNEQGIYQWCNAAWQALLQAESSAIAGSNDTQWFPGAVGQRLLEHDLLCLQATAEISDDVEISADDFIHLVQIMRVPLPGLLGEGDGILGIVMDASVQRILTAHVEELVSEMSALRHMLDQHALVTISDANGYYQYASSPFCRLFCKSADDILRLSRFDLGVVPDQVGSGDELLQGIDRGSISFDCQTRRPDGQLLWLQSIMVEIPRTKNNAGRYFEILNDITAIKLHEEQLADEVDRRTELLRKANRKLASDVIDRELIENNLRRQHALLDGVLSSLPEEVLVLDPRGMVIHVNHAWTQFREEICASNTLHAVTVNQHFANCCRSLPGDDAQALVQAIEAMEQGACNDVELTYQESTRIGPRWYRIRMRIWDYDHRAILLTLADMTEALEGAKALEQKNIELQQLNTALHNMQGQLIQSEKMASIGLLAAGVAHEINNPLGYISSNVSTLGGYAEDMLQLIERLRGLIGQFGQPNVLEQVKQAETALDFDYIKDDISGLLAETRDGVQRVKSIVQDLKDFSRLDAGQNFELGDINRGLESTLNIVNNELKYKCEVICNFGEIPPLECNLSQLNQVFLNLLVNAGHAIVERGIITVATFLVEDHVCVEITDTGCGIPPEVKNRIFEPFFTTKPVGQGTGLGLALSYGIIQKHHGRIELDSEVGRGTRFRLYLPLRGGNLPAETGAKLG